MQNTWLNLLIAFMRSSFTCGSLLTTFIKYCVMKATRKNWKDRKEKERKQDIHTLYTHTRARTRHFQPFRLLLYSTAQSLFLSPSRSDRISAFAYSVRRAICSCVRDSCTRMSEFLRQLAINPKAMLLLCICRYTSQVRARHRCSKLSEECASHHDFEFFATHFFWFLEIDTLLNINCNSQEIWINPYVSTEHVVHSAANELFALILVLYLNCIQTELSDPLSNWVTILKSTNQIRTRRIICRISNINVWSGIGTADHTGTNCCFGRERK